MAEAWFSAMHLNRLNYYNKSCTLFRLIARIDGQLPAAERFNSRPDVIHFRFSGFAGWQAPFMAQPAHPQPQDDFPFFLLRTILAIDIDTMRTKTALMMIVAIFSISHVSIEIPPVSLQLLSKQVAAVIFRQFLNLKANPGAPTQGGTPFRSAFCTATSPFSASHSLSALSPPYTA